MKQFYHFYVVLNNVENIDLSLDLEDILRIDEQWRQLLNKAKVELPQRFIDKMADEIYSRLF